jgi:prepilin-type N-terminal cleavage/methylation domain-containing protein
VRCHAQSRLSDGLDAPTRDRRDDSGFGLIEVVVAMTILALTLSAMGWLIVSTLSASEAARQKATASSLIEQVDALFQNNVPSMTCANAATYVSAAGSGTATRNGTVSVSGGQNAAATNYTVSSTSSTPSNGLLPVTISVSWRSATNSQSTATLSNSLLVQC